MGQFNVPPGTSLSMPGGPDDPALALFEAGCEDLFDSLYTATRVGFTAKEILELWAQAAEQAHYDDEHDADVEAESERQLAETEARAYFQFDPNGPQGIKFDAADGFNLAEAEEE